MNKRLQIPKPLWKVMHVTFSQLLMVVFLGSVSWAHDTHAQEVLNRSISVAGDRLELKSILSQIEKQADVKFVYSTQIKTTQRLTLNINNRKLSGVLDDLLRPLAISYEVIENRILLKKNKLERSALPNPPVPDRSENPAASVLDETVSGTVLDEKGVGLPGASVVVKGSTRGATTDASGKYSISIPNGKSVLTFSFIGYQTIEETVGNRTQINVRLFEDNKGLDEVVVIGYGTENRRDVLGSIGSIKAQQVEQVTPTSALEAMQGRLAGVQISSNGGPGEGNDIKIRGTSTLSGGVNPLYVVDGQQMENIDNLNPNDITSIEVLKDGASAAIYGSKSANGVVIISTKRGKSGKPQLDVNLVRTYNKIYNIIPVASSRQRLRNEQLSGGGTVGTGNSPDSLSLRYQQSIDQQSLLARIGKRDVFNVGLSGGGDKTSFYWNTGYTNEDGVILGSSYNRINTNLNMDAKIGNFINVGTRIMASYEYKKGLNEQSVFRQLSERPAYLPVYDYDGSLFPEEAGRENPIAEALFTRRDVRTFRGASFNYVEVKLLPSLSFKSTLGVNFQLQKLNNFDKTIVRTVGSPPIGSEGQGLDYDVLQENFFSFNKKLGSHNITALLGMSTQQWKEENSIITGTAFNSDLVETFNNVATLDLARTNTTAATHALSSVFGRVAYDYRSKYLISATIRRDGSSRFGADRRWGNFPGISAGWRISDEAFMKGLSGVISDLKVRVGYAITGNERIGNYESILLYSPGLYYAGVNGAAPVQFANPNLGWESTKQLNYGVDLSLFGGKLNTTLDFYTKTTTDLLYSVPVPQETGFTTVRKNIGSIQNKGVELSISGKPIVRGNFVWSTNFNIATNEATVLQLLDGLPYDVGFSKIAEGDRLGNITGYRNLGIYAYNESNAYSNDGVRLTPIFNDGGVFSGYQLNGQPYTGTVNKMKVGGTVLLGGDTIWEDLNNDFMIDNINDEQVIGNGFPTFFGGIFNEVRYKNFSVSALLDFNLGNDIYRYYDVVRNHSGNAGPTPSPERIDRAWVKPGDVTDYPSLARARAQNRLGAGGSNGDSKYINKGDYMKLRNIRLNYALPQTLLKRMKVVNAISVNLSVNNLLTFTNYTGYNPELGTRTNPLQPGIDALRYPNKTEVIIGLKMQL